MLFFIFSKKRTPFLNLAGVTLGHPSQGPTEKSPPGWLCCRCHSGKMGYGGPQSEISVVLNGFFPKVEETVEKHAACSNRDVRNLFFFWSEERRTSSLALMCVEILVLLVASSDRDIQDGPRADRDGVKWAPYKWPKIKGYWGYFTPIIGVISQNYNPTYEFYIGAHFVCLLSSTLRQ